MFTAGLSQLVIHAEQITAPPLNYAPLLQALKLLPACPASIVIVND
jgi:hypothetical protein